MFGRKKVGERHDELESLREELKNARGFGEQQSAALDYATRENRETLDRLLRDQARSWGLTVRLRRMDGLGERELAEAFTSAPNHPLWTAVLQVLEEEQLEWNARSRDETSTDKQTHMAIGAEEGLLKLLAKLQTFEAQAREVEQGENG